MADDDDEDEEDEQSLNKRVCGVSGDPKVKLSASKASSNNLDGVPPTSSSSTDSGPGCSTFSIDVA